MLIRLNSIFFASALLLVAETSIAQEPLVVRSCKARPAASNVDTIGLALNEPRHTIKENGLPKWNVESNGVDLRKKGARAFKLVIYIEPLDPTNSVCVDMWLVGLRKAEDFDESTKSVEDVRYWDDQITLIGQNDTWRKNYWQARIKRVSENGFTFIINWKSFKPRYTDDDTLRVVARIHGNEMESEPTDIFILRQKVEE